MTADQIIALEQRRALEPCIDEPPKPPAPVASDIHLRREIRELTMAIRDLIASNLVLTKTLADIESAGEVHPS